MLLLLVLPLVPCCATHSFVSSFLFLLCVSRICHFHYFSRPYIQPYHFSLAHAALGTLSPKGPVSSAMMSRGAQGHSGVRPCPPVCIPVPERGMYSRLVLGCIPVPRSFLPLLRAFFLLRSFVARPFARSLTFVVFLLFFFRDCDQLRSLRSLRALPPTRRETGAASALAALADSAAALAPAQSLHRTPPQGNQCWQQLAAQDTPPPIETPLPTSYDGCWTQGGKVRGRPWSASARGDWHSLWSKYCQ